MLFCPLLAFSKYFLNILLGIQSQSFWKSSIMGTGMKTFSWGCIHFTIQDPSYVCFLIGMCPSSR